LQGHDAAGDGPAFFTSQTHGRITVAGLGAKLLQSINTVRGISILPLVKPPQSMADAPVAFIVNVVCGQNVNAGRQGSNAEPIPGMQNECVLGVREKKIGAGMTILAYSADVSIRGNVCAGAGE
jgi:hypothetical protein